MRCRPLRGAWTAAPRGLLSLHPVSAYQWPFLCLNRDASRQPRSERVKGVTLVPIVLDGSARVLWGLRIKPFLGADLWRPDFYCGRNAGLADGAKSSGPRARWGFWRLLHDWRWLAPEDGWRSRGRDPGRLIGSFCERRRDETALFTEARRRVVLRSPYSGSCIETA